MFNKLLQPGESADYNAGGTWVRIDQGSKVSVITDNGHKAPLNTGDSAQFALFRTITVTNKSSVAETIVFRVSTGRIVASDDGGTVIVSNAVDIDDTDPIQVEVTAQPAINVTASVATANTIQSPLDVPLTAATATVISAANAARKELMIKNASSNATSVRIGSATVDVNKGLELEPGESIVLTTTAAVWGYSVPGQSVSLTELEVV